MNGTVAEMVVAEVLTWLGTPYRHQGRQKGVGCDCIGLVLGVWRAVYGKMPEQPEPYSPDWAEAGGSERLLAGVRRRFLEKPQDVIAAGELLVFRWRPHLPAKHAGILVEPIPVQELPAELTANWQLVDLAQGADHRIFRAVLPDGTESHITFSVSGLARLKAGLTRAGLDARFFQWPPESDPDRPPYRGMRPLEAEDAGIFFGREAPTIEALDRLRLIQRRDGRWARVRADRRQRRPQVGPPVAQVAAEPEIDGRHSPSSLPPGGCRTAAAW